MNEEKKMIGISRDLKRFEKISSLQQLEDLVIFKLDHINLSINLKFFYKGYGYSDLPIRIDEISKIDENVEISELHPVKITSIIDFTGNHRIPTLYMFNNKVIDGDQRECIKKIIKSLMYDIAILCAMANSRNSLHKKLLIDGHEKLVRNFSMTSEEMDILAHCLYYPEAILIRRITENNKKNPYNLHTLLKKMKKYDFFQEITSIDKDMMQIQENEDIKNICDFANKHIAHASKENAEEICGKSLQNAAKIIIDITNKYLSDFGNISYGFNVRVDSE